MSKYLNPFLSIPSVIFVDQASKYLAQELGLLIWCNQGIAFGFGQIGPVAVFAVLVAIAVFLAREKNYRSKLGFALIFAGGLSNLVDRVYFGCVRDFISVSKFPSFNLADFAICAGVVLLIYKALFLKNEA